MQTATGYATVHGMQVRYAVYVNRFALPSVA